MQAVLLNDIELDIRELRYLLEAISKEPETPLREVAKRRIAQIQHSLAELSDGLEGTVQLPVPDEFIPAAHAEKEKLLHLFSINDSFFFSRELFDGDTGKMNKALQEVDKMSSLEEALTYLTGIGQVDKEKEAYTGFTEILERHFAVKQ